MQTLIVYDTRSSFKIVRRLVIDDDGAGVNPAHHVGDGEAHLSRDHTELLDKPAHHHVAEHHGIDVASMPSGRCAIVGPDNRVVGLCVADPEIDSHPHGRLVASDTARIGDTLP